MYRDPNDVHNPADGEFVPAQWLDVVRDDLEHLAHRPLCWVLGGGGFDDGDLTEIEFSTNLRDNFGGHSLTSDTETIVIPSAGLYEVGLAVQWSPDGSSGTGRRAIYSYVNGGLLLSKQKDTPASATGCSQTFSTITSRAAGDEVTYKAVQTSGITLTLSAWAWVREVYL